MHVFKSAQRIPWTSFTQANLIINKAGITVRMCQNYARIRTITVRKCQNYSRIRVRTKLSEYAPNVLKPGLFALFLLFSNFFLNSNFVRTSESELRENGRMPALDFRPVSVRKFYEFNIFDLTGFEPGPLYPIGRGCCQLSY